MLLYWVLKLWRCVCDCKRGLIETVSAPTPCSNSFM